MGYFEWLCTLIDLSQHRNPNRSYSILFEQLYTTEFVWSIYNDENRSFDGISLRDEYIIHHGEWSEYEELGAPCTVLEMLIALARRSDFEASRLDIRDGIDEWFGLFLENLGLSVYNDTRYMEYIEAEEEIDEIVWAFMERRYSYNGEGGLFPLKEPVNDQRSVELWYQLSAYILENSDIVD